MTNINRGESLFKLLDQEDREILVSAMAFIVTEGNVEVWYSPDLTEVYDEYEEDYDDDYDDEENEPYLLGSIEGELDLRKLVSWLSFNKPEGFYFDEIKIQGVKGFWKDLIEISLYEEYSETLDHLLSLSDKELKLFWKKTIFSNMRVITSKMY